MNTLIDAVGRAAGGRYEHDIFVAGKKIYTETPDTPPPPAPSGKVLSLNPKDGMVTPQPGDVIVIEGGSVPVTPDKPLWLAKNNRVITYGASKLLLNGNFDKTCGVNVADGFYLDHVQIDNRNVTDLKRYSYPVGYFNVYGGSDSSLVEPINGVITGCTGYGVSDWFVYESYWLESPGRILIRDSFIQTTWDNIYAMNTGYNPNDWTARQYPASAIFSVRRSTLVSLGLPWPDYNWWTLIAACEGAAIILTDCAIGQMGRANQSNKSVALFHAWQQGCIVLGHNNHLTQYAGAFDALPAHMPPTFTAMAAAGIVKHPEGQPSYVFDFGKYVAADKFSQAATDADTYLVAKNYV